jgi:hypothetical protein
MASLFAAAVGGVLIGLYGVAALSPLPPSQSALVFGYAVACSLGPNDLVKSFLSTRALRPAPSKIVLQASSSRASIR